MTTTIDAPVSVPRGSRPTGAVVRHQWLLIAGVASLSGGAIHAAAVGAHSEHPAASRVFIVVALLQMAWGAAALTRPGKVIALVGVVMNAALFGGWVLAKTKGLTFIDGLDQKEPVQFADALAAALAVVSCSAAAWSFVRTRTFDRPRLFVGSAIAVIAVLAFPGMVEAGNHVHRGEASQVVVVGADGKAVLKNASAAVPTRPYDPKLPIDLGGVAGVTPEEQARAENLVAITLVRLPQWSDTATAIAAGYHSIADGITGFEHYINWNYLNDGKTLDPDHPESLVYRVTASGPVLEAAMYMLAPGATFDTVPDVGGALTQWHIHDNLCFTDSATAPLVAGLTDAGGACHAPLVKLRPVPMIHVWIVPEPCGPFAALEGIGGGQIKPGEQRLCDHVHGSTTGL